MKKILIYSSLLLWTIWALSRIIPNANHYSVLDWVIVITVYTIPCSILIIFDVSTSKHHCKPKDASPSSSESPEASFNEPIHMQQSTELDLLAWQNILYPDTTQLRFNAYQLKKLSASITPRQSEIAHDCMKLINSTAVPETFFSRYDLLIEKLTLLSNLEKYVRFNTYSPTLQLSSAIRKKSPATNNFIDRYWNSTVKKASSLKTEKGRRNRYKKFYYTLLKYTDKMTEENILHVENIVKDKIEIERHEKKCSRCTNSKFAKYSN